MKIDEFLKNPVGKGAFIPGKADTLRILDYRMSLLLERKKIELKIYKNNNDVWYHLIIPTENKDRECSYDVVIKFKATDKSDLYDSSYRQYEIEFFSNCPSFTYGYAYVANINGYFIKELSDKYPAAVLKYPPVSKNPGLTFGYEKSIYFACKYIMGEKQLLSKSYVDSYSQKLTPDIIKSIRTHNKIEEEYKRADKVMRENKKINRIKVDKKTQIRKDKILRGEPDKKSGVNVVKKTKGSKNNKKIQPVKKKK